jgi:hypothetical protein
VEDGVSIINEADFVVLCINVLAFALFIAVLIGGIYGSILGLLNFLLLVVASIFRIDLVKYQKPFAKICALISSMVTAQAFFLIVRDADEPGVILVYGLLGIAVTIVTFVLTQHRVMTLIEEFSLNR